MGINYDYNGVVTSISVTRHERRSNDVSTKSSRRCSKKITRRTHEESVSSHSLDGA